MRHRACCCLAGQKELDVQSPLSVVAWHRQVVGDQQRLPGLLDVAEPFSRVCAIARTRIKCKVACSLATVALHDVAAYVWDGDLRTLPMFEEDCLDHVNSITRKLDGGTSSRSGTSKAPRAG